MHQFLAHIYGFTRAKVRYMPPRRSEWRNPVLHVGAVLFGCGFGFLMMFPLMAIFSYSLHIPVVRTLSDDIPPWWDGWVLVMFILVSWTAGVAATYGLIGLLNLSQSGERQRHH